MTNLIAHDVDTGEATPIKKHPYWINPQKWVQVEPELLYMEETGVTEQSSSECSPPLVPLPKPDLTVHPCIGYRKVNNVTKMDIYFMPRPEDCTDKYWQCTACVEIQRTKGLLANAIDRQGKRGICICVTGMFVSLSSSSIWHKKIRKKMHQQLEMGVNKILLILMPLLILLISLIIDS